MTKRVSMTEFFHRLDEPNVKHLLARLNVVATEAQLFSLLANASCLQGSLRLPRKDGGYVVVPIDWDHEEDAPLGQYLAELLLREGATT